MHRGGQYFQRRGSVKAPKILALAAKERVVNCALTSPMNIRTLLKDPVRRWKFAAALALVLYLAVAAEGNAAYLIKLKNGKEFITARYWQTGKQVMFETYGGVFGIDKSFVTTIELSDKPIQLTVTTQEISKEKIQNDSSDKKEVAKPETSVEAKPEAKRDDDPITQEFNRLKERSKSVEGMLTPEIRELLAEITAFKSKIRADGELFFKYGREFNDASELGTVVETVLRARNQ
jgi:hypothetical protein